MDHRRTVRCLALAVAVSFLIGGCSRLAQELSSRIRRRSLPVQSSQSRGASGEEGLPVSVDLPAIDELAALPAGPGLIVGQPVVDTDNEATGEFGAGCSRWLQFNVGGRFELGRTPFWGGVAMLALEMPSGQLQFTKEDLPRIAGICSATHIALGRVRGSPDHSTLTYRVFDLESGRENGDPIILQGSHQEIVRQLPAVGRAILERMDASADGLPTTVAESPDDLQFLGRTHWWPDVDMAMADFNQLKAVAERSHLAAALLFIQYRTREPHQSYLLAKRLREASLSNQLLLGLIGEMYRDHVMPRQEESFSGELEELVEQYPNNATAHVVLSYSDFYEHRVHSAVQEAQVAFQCAPDNVYVATNYADMISRLSDRILGGISLAEMPKYSESLTTLYRQHLALRKRLTKQYPSNASKWHWLSLAAIQSGEAELATKALNKALELEPKRPATYIWGLRLYGPGWLDSKGDQERIVKLILEQEFDDPDERQALSRVLWDSGYKESVELNETQSERAVAEISITTARIRRGEDQATVLAETGSAWGRSLQVYTHPVTAVDWSADGTLVAGVAGDKVPVRDLKSGKDAIYGFIRGHRGEVMGVKWHPSKMQAATCGADETVRVWDVSDPRASRELFRYEGHAGAVTGVDWSPDGESLVTVGVDGTVRTWSGTKQGKRRTLWSGSSPIASVAWSPNGQRIAVVAAPRSGEPTTIYILNAESGGELGRLEGHVGGSVALAWNPEGNRIVAPGEKNNVLVWNAVNGKRVLVLRGHTEPVEAVAWSSDGQLIATAGRDKTIWLWQASSGQPLEFHRGKYSRGFLALAFRQDGARLISGTRSKNLVLWHLDELYDRIPPHEHKPARANPLWKLLPFGR